MDGLKQALNTEELQSKKLPAVSALLEKEKLLFSKEIEVMYDVDQSDVRYFMEKELSQEQVQMKEFLGEHYFTTST